MTWADDRQAGHLLLSAGVIAGEADVSHMVGRRQLWTKAAMLIGQAESRAHFWLDASCILNTGTVEFDFIDQLYLLVSCKGTNLK